MCGPMLAFLLSAITADPSKLITSLESPQDFGYGLTSREAACGWISLFDGETSFGWQDAVVEDGVLRQGQTTMPFGNVELRADVITPGEMTIGGQLITIAAGRWQATTSEAGLGTIRLGSGLGLKTLFVRPLSLTAVFNGKDLAGWTVVKHPQLPDEGQAKWTVAEGSIRAIGGPGCLELKGVYGDLVLQVEARTRDKLVNGGVFFRSMPGQFLRGYEAQIFNGCYEHDPNQPVPYSTGALDDRQSARRIVSRDGQAFTMTVLAIGPRIATWVNGYQTIDWTDNRDQDENPRQGLRLKPGAIQLQAHDPKTDLEFLSIRMAEAQ